MVDNTAKQPPNRYSWKIKCIALALSIGFSFVVAESALRFLPQFSYLSDGHPPMYEADPARIWRLRPNLAEIWPEQRFEQGQITVHTDELGNRKIAPPNKLDDLPQYNILLLGDSYTFGWGVEEDETYGALLQAALNAQLTDRRIRITNSGVSGYGPENEFETLKQLWDSVKPQLVLLGFTENDFENVASGKDYLVVQDGWMVPKEVVRNNSFSQRSKQLMIRHSKLARLAYILRTTPQTTNRPFLGYTLEILRKKPVPQVTQAIQRTTEVLREIRDYCAAHQVPFVLASFPRSYQIYQEEFVERLKQSGESPDDFSADILSERIKSICDQLGVQRVPVEARFQRARKAGIKRDELFIENDGHWKREGHMLASEVLLPELIGVIRKH